MPAAKRVKARRERLNVIPRRLFALSLKIPNVKVKSGANKERSITFQKAALWAVQMAAEKHVADLVSRAIHLPGFQQKTLQMSHFVEALNSTPTDL